MTDNERRLQIAGALSAVSTLGDEELDDAENPTNQAYNWIVNEDSYYICPDDANLEQRYILALFYFATNGENWVRCRPESTDPCEGQNFLSASHECEWGGVSCDENEEITKLNLGKFGKNSFIH